MWLQGRALWMFAKLYNEVEQRPEWLDAARHIYDFIMRCGFDSRRPHVLRRHRRRPPAAQTALPLHRDLRHHRLGGISPAPLTTPPHLNARSIPIAWSSITCASPANWKPKVFPETRRAKAHNVSMIMLATTQELRLAAPPDPLYAEVVDDALDQILNHFLDAEAEAVFEVLGADGERLDTGRWTAAHTGPRHGIGRLRHARSHQARRRYR